MQIKWFHLLLLVIETSHEFSSSCAVCTWTNERQQHRRHQRDTVVDETQSLYAFTHVSQHFSKLFKFCCYVKHLCKNSPFICTYANIPFVRICMIKNSESAVDSIIAEAQGCMWSIYFRYKLIFLYIIVGQLVTAKKLWGVDRMLFVSCDELSLDTLFTVLTCCFIIVNSVTFLGNQTQYE